MTTTTKKLIVIQVALAIVLGVVLGALGLLSLINYGGNFDFPNYFGLPGYEGSGLVGFHAGLVLAAWLAAVLGGALRKVTGSYIRAAVVCVIALLGLLTIGFRVDYMEIPLVVDLLAYASLVIATLFAWHSDRNPQ